MLLTILLGVLVIFMAYQTVLGISRFGENKVEIIVLPKESRIYLDNKPSKAGDIYIKPGKYTVKATAEGYSDAKTSVLVDGNTKPVILLPEPASDKATDFLIKNSDVQAKREELGGKLADQAGKEITDKYPIVAKLPVADLLGPFSIDYGFSQIVEGGVFIQISDSSPKGRQKALQWIKDQGQDPTEYEISYSDFSNPLILEGEE